MEAIQQVYQWSTITHNFKVHTISLLFRIIILCLLIVVVPFTVNLFSLIHLLNYLNYIKFLNFLLQSLHCDWFKKLTPLSQPIETFSIEYCNSFPQVGCCDHFGFQLKRNLKQKFSLFGIKTQYSVGNWGTWRPRDKNINDPQLLYTIVKCTESLFSYIRIYAF